MELLPVGPVTFLDTAGLDDETELSGQRIEKTMKVVNRIDVAVVVCDFIIIFLNIKHKRLPNDSLL